VETPGAGAITLPPGSPMRVRDNAVGRTWRSYELVRAHDVGLRWADVPALHALRIDAKRLRYNLESFAEVLPPETAQLIATVVAVQDHLGALNDAHVAAEVTRTWLIASAPWLAAETRDAAGAYLADREHEVARLRRTFPPIWRRVSGPTFRRRLAVALSSL
jgi:CHAD domain-containing protein